TARAVRHTLFIVAAGAALLAIFAPFLLEALFGSRYLPADDSLRILCVGTALFAPQALLSNYFTVQLGKPWIPMSVASASCLINIALSAALIPRIGFVGGAWATTVSYALAGLFSVSAFIRLSDARIPDLWRPRRDDIGIYVRTAREAVDRLANLRPPADRAS
ncbi:MAG: polysaccharide biosynthesis C-terminal domain-containing protein, partial [Dehalococcoidia bacterium]